jgi:hypothetical protein
MPNGSGKGVVKDRELSPLSRDRLPRAPGLAQLGAVTYPRSIRIWLCDAELLIYTRAVALSVEARETAAGEAVEGWRLHAAPAQRRLPRTRLQGRGRARLDRTRDLARLDRRLTRTRIAVGSAHTDLRR